MRVGRHSAGGCNTNVFNPEFFLVLAFPIVWFVGISLVYFQFLIFYFFLRRRLTVTVLPKLLIPILVFIIVYLLSLVINFNLRDLERFIASFNNYFIWVCGLLLSIVVINWKELNESVLSIYSRLVLYFIFTVAVYVLLFGNEPLYVVSFVGKILNPDAFPQLVTDSLRLKVLSKDWFDGEGGVRNAIFSPYSTATAAVSILLFCIATINLSVFSKKYFLYSLVCFVCVLSTYSRLVVSVFMIFLLLSFLMEIKSGKIRLLLLVLATFLAFTFIGYLPTIWSEVNDLRAGSSSIRFEVYRATYELAIESSPIIGLAIKDRSEFFIPLGSHSTYLGIFLKTGVLGLACILLYVLMISVRTVRFYFIGGTIKEGRYISVLAAFTVYMAFEDMDAAQYMSFMYFLVVGLYERERKRFY